MSYKWKKRSSPFAPLEEVLTPQDGSNKRRVRIEDLVGRPANESPARQPGKGAERLHRRKAKAKARVRRERLRGPR